MPNFDMIIVGSGINSLVCAALLTQRGRSVCVLERNEVLGGCLRTEELTRSGFKHDTLATLFPLFTSAPHYAALEQPLREAGVEFLNSDTPTGVLLPDGRAAVLTRDRQRNAEEFARLAADDGKAYRRAMEDIEKHAALTFTLLGEELWTLGALRKVLRHAWRTGVGEVGAYGAAGLASCRSWLSGAFVSDVARTLIAPWVLHVGLGPESAGSALMAKLILFTLEGAGSPVVRGGSAGIVTAFAQLIAAGAANAIRMRTSSGF